MVDNESDLAKVKDVPRDRIKPIPFTLEDAFIAVVQKSRHQDSAENRRENIEDIKEDRKQDSKETEQKGGQ
jgi:hypothetical protein